MPEAVHAQQPEITVALAEPERGPLSPQDASFKAKSISRALRRAANKSRAPTSVIAGGGGFQARRGDRAFRLGVLASFAAFVIAPFLVASIYWGLIASKQYVTETKFALRAGEASSLDLLSGGAMGSQASQQMQDAQVLVNFIRSRSMVEALDRKVGLRAMFSRSGVDYFSSFDPEDSVEELEKYWKRRIDASIDMMSGIISVNVRAFTPRDSLAIAQNVTDLSERLVNELSTRSRRDALAQARTELTRAEEQLKNATGSMRDARNTEGVLDAPAAAEAINKLITTLRLELAQTQEDLALHSDSATSDSPQARLLTARVQSLKSQIDEYSTQIAGGGERGRALWRSVRACFPCIRSSLISPSKDMRSPRRCMKTPASISKRSAPISSPSFARRLRKNLSIPGAGSNGRLLSRRRRSAGSRSSPSPSSSAIIWPNSGRSSGAETRIGGAYPLRWSDRVFQY